MSFPLVAAFAGLLVACQGEQQPASPGAEVGGGVGGSSGGATESAGGTRSGVSPVASTEDSGVTDTRGGADAGAVRPAGDANGVDVADASNDPTVDPLPACTLGTAVDCADCGDPACALANTILACTSADQCARAVCAPGFGNCDSSTLDCETSFAAGGSCLPSHTGTTGFATTYLYASGAAMGTDGSSFLVGAFRGTLDFDPTGGDDIHVAGGPGDQGVFVTKLDAAGSYEWTGSFYEPGIALGPIAATADGGVVVAGIFARSVDLDPGPGVDQHEVSAELIGRHVMVIKLAADGSLVWGRTLEGTVVGALGSVTSVAVDAAGDIYITGSFTSTVDFDPGPAAALRTASPYQAGMLVKLTSAGEFSWVRTLDEARCTATFGAVAIATDGRVWAAGTGCGSEAGPGVAGALFAAYTPEGNPEGLWRLPPSRASHFGVSVAAGANGSMYVGGLGSGLVDVDPGPGVAMRWLGYLPGGFLLKVAPDSSLLWAQSFPDTQLVGLAATSDGGVVLAGPGPSTGIVAKVGPEGNPDWTFALGDAAEAVAVRGNSFVVAGAATRATDFDPGAGTQLLDGNIRFISRFDF